MEATVLKLYEYLNQDKIDIIPVYQRNYSWKKENCSQLFNDILKAGESEKIEIHFIGSIIVIVDGGLNGNTNIIIDGQQRVTTAILFLKAFYDETDNDYFKDEFIKRQLFKITEDGKQQKLILNKDDNSILEKILKGDNLKDNEKTSKIFQNYDYFRTEIKNNDEKTLIDGFKKLRVVGIRLNITENPQLIFESLNSTGLQLNATDLIRNFLLMSSTASEQDRLYSGYWYKIEQNITNEYMVEFFKSYLTIKTLEVVAVNKVYEKFKEYILIQNLDIEKTLEDLLFYSNVYAKLIFTNLEEDENIKLQIQDIEKLNQKVIYPFLLECYISFTKNILTKEEFLDILAFLENYLIRSIVCEDSNKGLNKFNSNLIKEFNNNSDKVKSIKNIFINTTSKSRMKSDKEFITALKYNKIYQNKTIKAGKVLLYKIDKILNPKEKIEDDKISVEHIMPQTLSIEWKVYLGEEYKFIFAEYLHTLGNLTLTGYNRELSNKPFIDKKELLKDSNFSLNSYFNDIEFWTKEQIEARADTLIWKLLEIYPFPSQLIETNEEQINSFLLSERNEITIQNTKPNSIDLFDTHYKVKSWRDLYAKTVEVIYDKYQELFDKHIELNSFNANKNLLSLNKEDMAKLSHCQIGNFYLNTNLSSTQTLSNISTLFQVLEIDEEELYIYLAD